MALLSLDDAGPVERYEAAVDRWIDRAHAERPGLAAAPLRRLLDWLPDLGAVTQLQTICEQQAWPVALVALDHLLPAAPRLPDCVAHSQDADEHERRYGVERGRLRAEPDD